MAERDVIHWLEDVQRDHQPTMCASLEKLYIIYKLSETGVFL